MTPSQPSFQDFTKALGVDPNSTQPQTPKWSDKLQSLYSQSQPTEPETTPNPILNNPVSNAAKAVGNFVGDTTGITGAAKAIAGAAGVVAQPFSSEKVIERSNQANRLIDQAKTLHIDDPQRKALLMQAHDLSGQAGDIADSANKGLEQSPTAEQSAGSFGKLGLTAATAGMGTPASIAGKIGQGALIGGGFGGAQGMESGKDIKGVATSAGIGAAIGAAVPTAIEGIKWAVKGVPKLLSYTSSTPESILQRNYDNPEVMGKAQDFANKEGVGGVRQVAQGAVKTLRTDLSKQWEEGLQPLIDQNQGIRMGFNQAEQKTLNKIADQYGIEVPQNLNSMSVNEILDLNKNINELYSKVDVKMGSGGIPVRQFKDILDNQISKFTGAKDFLSNYATEKGVLDNADSVLKAYGTKPSSIRLAETNLRNLFNENNGAYLSAVKDLEDKTGIPIIDKAMSLKTSKLLPTEHIGLSGSLAKLVDLIALPLRSPKMAGILSRIAGKAPDVLSGGTTQAITKATSALGGELAGQ